MSASGWSSRRGKVSEEYCTTTLCTYNSRSGHAQGARKKKREPFMSMDDLFTAVDVSRTWMLTSYGKENKQKPDYGMVFTVMSYNILAQDLLESNMFLYEHCSPEYLTWEYRKNNLLKEIRKAAVDFWMVKQE